MTLDVLVLPFYGGKKKKEPLTMGGVSISMCVAFNLVLGGSRRLHVCYLGLAWLCCAVKAVMNTGAIVAAGLVKRRELV